MGIDRDKFALKVGKTYKTRSGRRVMISETGGNVAAGYFIDAPHTYELWHPDGSYSFGEESELDLSPAEQIEAPPPSPWWERPSVIIMAAAISWLAVTLAVVAAIHFLD